MMFDDQRLFSVEQLIALVQTAKIGQKVKFSLLRNGKSEMLEAALTEHSVGVTEAHSQARWGVPQWWMRPRPADLNWDRFDSLTIKSLGEDRYRVEISYETQDRKIEHKTFEGTLAAIHRRIVAQKDLPADEREHLLRALDTAPNDSQFALPEILVSPDGSPSLKMPQPKDLPRQLLPDDF